MALKKTARKTQSKKTKTELGAASTNALMTKVTVLLRDPHWAYCYWDLAPDQVHEARRELDYTKKKVSTFLRVWDKTDPEDVVNFDIDVGSGVDGWYIRLDEEKEYMIEVGFGAHGGSFYPLVKSGIIKTPKLGVVRRTSDSPSRKGRLTRAEEEFSKIYALSKGLDSSASPHGMEELDENGSFIFPSMTINK